MSVESYTVPEGKRGDKGFGVAVFFHSTIRDKCRLWRVSKEAQVVWVRCDRSVFGTTRDVILGAGYVPPFNGDESRLLVLETSFATISAEIQDIISQDLLPAFFGDVNAHLDKRSEYEEEGWEDMLLRFPELQGSRMVQGVPKLNSAGSLLLETALAGRLICTTGRGRGDNGEATFYGYGDKLKTRTRTEHVLLHPDLYELLQSTRFCEGGRVSDHIQMILEFKARRMETEGLHGTGHRCGQECQRKAEVDKVLVWDQEKREVFGETMGQAWVDRQEQFKAALAAKEVEQVDALLHQMIVEVADSLGMTRAWRCSFQEHRGGGAKRQPWWTRECQKSKEALWQARQRGVWGAEYNEMKRVHRGLCRRVECRWNRRKVEELIKDLDAKDPKAWKQMRPKREKVTTPIPIEDVGEVMGWHSYVKNKFDPQFRPQPPAPVIQHRHQQQEIGLVALGRRQQQAATSGGARPFNPEDPSSHPKPSDGDLFQLVLKALGSLKSGTATGFDNIPAEFLKYAQVKHGETTLHVLAPLFRDLFKLLMDDGVVVKEWKKAKICPLYKKGEVSNCNSYRMLAISSVLYRLYSNTLREMTTKWCIRFDKIPETQFGFYPGRNTLQPMFILRHLTHLMQYLHRQDKRRSPILHAAFMDFTQAYDTVPRDRLWQHLEKQGMPPWMLKAIKALYQEDEYILVDGHKQTAPIQPSLGVKQGCPLSPLLFALYINDFKLSPPMGAPLCRTFETRHGREYAQYVTHLFYADDLCLLSPCPSYLQAMLKVLEGFADAKGLTINVSKSEVVNFNDKRAQPLSPFSYKGVDLETKEEFKYLGLWFPELHFVCRAEKQWARNLLIASNSTLRKAEQYGVKSRLDLVLRLFDTYALPLGLYASQIWSTPLLHETKQLDNDLQRRHSTFLRVMAGVHPGVPTRTLLAEFGQRPLQYQWWKGVLSFWNDSVANQNSPLLKLVLGSDAKLADDGCTTNWTAEVRSALRLMEYQGPIPSRSLLPLPLDEIMDHWHQRFNSYWDQFQADTGGYRDPHSLNRPVRTYAQCFLPTPSASHAEKVLPRYLNRVHNTNVTRFRLGSHHLAVRTGRYLKQEYSMRTCNRCTTNYVDDEHHLIFACPALDHLRPHSASTALTVAGFMNRSRQSHLDFVAKSMEIIDTMFYAH